MVNNEFTSTVAAIKISFILMVMNVYECNT